MADINISSHQSSAQPKAQSLLTSQDSPRIRRGPIIPTRIKYTLMPKMIPRPKEEIIRPEIRQRTRILVPRLLVRVHAMKPLAKVQLWIIPIPIPVGEDIISVPERTLDPPPIVRLILTMHFHEQPVPDPRGTRLPLVPDYSPFPVRLVVRVFLEVHEIPYAPRIVVPAVRDLVVRRHPIKRLSRRTAELDVVRAPPG